MLTTGTQIQKRVFIVRKLFSGQGKQTRLLTLFLLLHDIEKISPMIQ